MYNKEIKAMTVNELKTIAFYTFMRSQKENEGKGEYITLYANELDLPEKDETYYKEVKEKIKVFGYPIIMLDHISSEYFEFYDSNDIESYFDYNKDFKYIDGKIITKENNVKMPLVEFVEKYIQYYEKYKDKRFFDFVE